MSTTSVVHGYLIVLEETQKKPIKPKAQINPIKPNKTHWGGILKKNPGFFNPDARVFSTLMDNHITCHEIVLKTYFIHASLMVVKQLQVLT